MAFGDKKGALTGNGNSQTNPSVISGSVAVAVGDLVFGVAGQQTNLTATTTISDNLGNSYSFQNAGTDAGTPTGRPFWGRITVAGTLTTINVPATASTNDYANRAVVIEGPFQVNPLDANPANITSDVTSPFTCPATGTLGLTPEVIIAWGAKDGNAAWSATSPNTLDGNTANSTNISVVIGYQAVTATTTVSPAFTGTNPTAAVLGTASFKGVQTGTAAQTFKKFGTSASGSEVFTGTSAQTFKKFTQSATGVMQPSGTAAQTFPNLEQSASGTERFTGTSAQTFPNLEQAASGSEVFTGTSAQTFPNLEQSASGTSEQPNATGTAAQEFPGFTQAASGGEAFTGSAAQTFASLDQSASGAMQPSGSGASELPSLTQAASGSEIFTGTAASELPSLTQAASGVMHPSGSAASAFPNFEQSASGLHQQNVTGTGAERFPSFDQAASGGSFETLSGSSAQILPRLQQAGVGAIAFSGSGAQTFAALVQSASGAQTFLAIGSAASLFAALEQEGIGIVANPPIIAAVASRVTIGSASPVVTKGESGFASSVGRVGARIE